MPAQISELDIMDEDQLIEEVLDKFVNCHEQTYEEFLSTFTHLSKGKMKSTFYRSRDKEFYYNFMSLLPFQKDCAISIHSFLSFDQLIRCSRPMHVNTNIFI